MSDQDLYQKATVYLQQGRLAEAESVAKSILDNDPNNAGANHLLGLIASQRKQNARAVRYISRAIKYNPFEPVYFFHLGIVLQLEGRVYEALSAYDDAIKLYPDSAQVHNNRGSLLKDLGRPAEALAAYEYAIHLNPNFALAHNNRGGALSDLGRVDEALEAFTRATELDPHLFQAHNNRGILLKNSGLELKDKGRLMAALAAHEQAVKVNPEFAEAHCHRGTILKWFGRLCEAKEAYRNALRYDPTLTEAQYFLAALGSEETPPQSPRDYVIKEFDGFAHNFDDKLQGELGYKTPQHLFDAVSSQIGGGSKKFNILDLGCGTGLSGLAFKDIADELVGVDLSPRMLEKAQERGIYKDLIEADACQALGQFESNFDLVLAADVFVYIGKLDEIFAKTVDCLRHGGLFAFSVETKESGKGYDLTLTGRYAHTISYIQKLAKGYGFEEMSCNPVTLRYERGQAVAGCIVVLRSPS